MKKRLLSVALAVVMVVCLVGCGTTTYQEATEQTESNASRDFGNGYFAVITEQGGYKIVYAKDTKVKYLIGYRDYPYSQFGITPLYNADGTLQIYEESED